jgi:Flp pilus assembly pilin Flp
MVDEISLRSLVDEAGQDIAEYGIMIALVVVVATAAVWLIGINAQATYSSVGSFIAQN